MRALRYNGKLVYDTDHPDPAPGQDECLVRVRLAGLAEADLQIAADRTGFTGVLGHELVGTVQDGPPKWQGKRIVCEINCVCRACDMCLSGLSNHCRQRTVLGRHRRDGCFADLVAVPVRNLHAVPDALTDEEAVFVETLAAAYQVLAQCAIDRRMKVSVVGAGQTGLLVAQVLRTTGCTLTVVGDDPGRLEFCEKKGIQGILVDELVPLQDRDVVVVCCAAQQGLPVAMSLIRPRGTLVLKGNDIGSSPRGDTAHRRTVPTPAPPAAPTKDEPLLDLSRLAENEITLLGSRCGPFPVAIDALARGAVDVRSMVSRVFDFDDVLTALDYATGPNVIKTLLRL